MLRRHSMGARSISPTPTLWRLRRILRRPHPPSPLLRRPYLPSPTHPTIQQHRYDSRNSFLEWSIVLIDDSNCSGSMEFVVPATESSVFFPISVQFKDFH